MPPEPNQRMHELLKGYAAKRRGQAGPPMELHPATRNLLQGEVARTFREQTASSPASPRLAWWPRLILGGAGVALLAAAAIFWFDFGRQTELSSAAQESNLFFFAQSGYETRGRSNPPEANWLADRVQRFELSMSRPKGVQPVRPGSLSSNRGEEVASTLSSAKAEPRLDLALSLPPRQEGLPEDAVSNAPRYSYGLPRQAGGVAGGLQPADEAPATSPMPAIAPRTLVRDPAAPAAPVPVTAQAANDSKQGIALEKARPAGPQAAAAPGRTLALGSPSAAPGSEQLARYGLRARSAPAPEASARTQQGWRFQQIDQRSRYRQNLNSPPAPRVLTDFAFEASGQDVRIVDADGSVYTGNIQPVPAAAGGAAPGQAARPTAVSAVTALAENGSAVSRGSPAQAIPSQAFNFQAAGTNRSLNQLVVFTGQVQNAIEPVSAPTPAAGLAQTVQAGRGAQRLGGQLNQANVLSNAGRIDGRAKIGPKTELRIEAQQVGP